MSLFCEARPYQNSDDPETHPVFRGKQHVHLMADSVSELVAYATSIGMNAHWLQRGSLPHFDCTGKFMDICMRDSRVEKLDRAAFVERFQRLRKSAVNAQ